MFENFYKKDRRKLEGTFIELDLAKYIRVTATLRFGLYGFSVACYLLSVYMVTLRSFTFVIFLLLGFLGVYLAKRVKSPQRASKGFLIGDTFCVVEGTTLHFSLAGDYKAYSLSKLSIVKSKWNVRKQRFMVTLQEKRKDDVIVLYLTEKSWRQLITYISH